MTRYSWIAWDADGTLFDYDRAESTALATTLERYGCSFDIGVLGLFREINTRLWREFEQGKVSSNRLRTQRFEELFAELGASISAEAFGRDYLHDLGGQSMLIPRAGFVVQMLHRFAGLVLATNGIADVQRRRMAASTLHPYFRAIVISDEVGFAKPAAGFFESMFDTAGISDKKAVLMVGDGLHSDIAGAARFGIDSCWYNPTCLPNASGIVPTFEISDLRDVLTVAGVSE